MKHEKFMELALQQAQRAASLGEVPVGAVIVSGDEVVATGHNEREASGNPLGHAEMLTLQRAAAKRGSWRLDGLRIYVTLEPCPMCAGAILQTRLAYVIFGASDPRAGCCGTLYNLLEDQRFPTRCQVRGGVLQVRCANILQDFFRVRRNS